MAHDFRVSRNIISSLHPLRTELFSPRNLAITGIAVLALATIVYYLTNRSCPRKVELSGKFIELLKKRYEALGEEKQLYRLIAKQSNTNFEKNRYPDIKPFQANIFQFKDPSLYFNASQVLKKRAISCQGSLPTEHKAISCQGPLPIEHKRFWRMAWEFNASAVVMVTDLIEGTKQKCSWYLPSDKGQTLPAAAAFDLPEPLDLTVIQRSGPPAPVVGAKPEIVHREIELQVGQDKKTISHYHFAGWGDFKDAPEGLLAQLVQTVYDSCYSQNKRLIVHCSAGIGRSGTFLTTLEAFAMLKSAGRDKLPLDFIDNIIRNLRSEEEGRVGMVQTEDQYILIYKTLAVLDARFHDQFCSRAWAK